MKDETLPTYRKGRRRQSSSDHFDDGGIDVPTNGNVHQKVDSLKKKKKVFGRYSWLAIFVSGSLCYTNYSLESVTELKKEVSHFHENQTEIEKNYQIEKETISVVNKKPRQNANRSNTTKFEWDGSRRKGKKTYMMFDMGFDDGPKLIFKTQRKQNQVVFKGMDFGQMIYAGKLAPCRLDQHNSCLPERSSVNQKAKAEKDPRILLYNPLQEDRFWCGERIPGDDILLIKNISDECSSKTNIFSLPYVYSNGPPAVLNEGIHANNGSSIPVELVEEATYFGANRAKLDFKVVPCSVPCKRHEDRDYLKTIKVANTNWTLRTTIEGERYYPAFKVRPVHYRQSIFYATTSFKSEIPMPYFSLHSFSDIQPAVDFDKAIKGASFIANNCNSHNRREDVVKELFDTELRVDSLSSCLNNAEPPNGVDTRNKESMQEQYLFHLAFENQNADDYITEKLWDTFKSGTLPVYLGAKNIKEHVPDNSIVVAEDFQNPQALADYLINLSKDRALYESYHEWRNKPLDDWFVEKYKFSNTPSICRTCKWAYAKRHGLGWSHGKQTVSNPHIHHKTCQDTRGLVEYPFKEHWFSALSEDGKERRIGQTQITSSEGSKTCGWNDKNRVLEIDNGKVRRKVYDRDGVTDLFIDFRTDASQSSNQSDHYLLRLETPIKPDGVNSEAHVVHDSAWWIQDDESRVYVMVSGDGDIELSYPKPGTIEITIPSSPSRSDYSTAPNTTTTTTTSVRVRVVSEDVDHFHLDAEKFTTYFGDLMMRDFFQPVESYKILNY